MPAGIPAPVVAEEGAVIPATEDRSTAPRVPAGGVVSLMVPILSKGWAVRAQRPLPETSRSLAPMTRPSPVFGSTMTTGSRLLSTSCLVTFFFPTSFA